MVLSIAENTAKHHRIRTEQEKVGDVFSSHLGVIVSLHKKVQAKHQKDLKKAGDSDFNSIDFHHLHFDSLETTL